MNTISKTRYNYLAIIAVFEGVLILVSANSAQAVITDSLKAHYEFEEASGQDVLDSTSNNLDGYLGASTGDYPNTDPARVAGLISQALDFVPNPPESQMDMVTLPASNQFITGASAPVTISAWTDPDSIGSAHIANRIFTLYRDSGAASTGLSLTLGDSSDGGLTGNLCLAWNDGSGFTTTAGNNAVSSTDGWHHVAVTYTGMNATLYLDGVWDKTITTPVAPMSTGTARIGAFDMDTQGCDGMIDDVGVWTRALSAAEIWSIARAGQAGTSLAGASSLVPAPLGLYYKLDESAGTAAEDSSGNGNTGALTTGLNFTGDSVPGVLGRGLDFDGTNDYINVPNTAGLPGAGDDFTVTTWVNVSEWDTNALVASYNLNGVKWNIGMHNEGPGVLNAATDFGSNQAYAIDSSSLPDDEFVHVAVLYTAAGGVADMFVNGQPIAEMSNRIWTLNDQGDDFGIGRRFHSVYSAYYLNGALDDFAIFSRMLTPHQIYNVMTYGAEFYSIPEPTTLLLLSLGGLTLLARRRKATSWATKKGTGAYIG